MHNPPHPGGIVRRQCLEPLGLTVTEAAEALGQQQLEIGLVIDRQDLGRTHQTKPLNAENAEDAQRTRVVWSPFASSADSSASSALKSCFSTGS